MFGIAVKIGPIRCKISETFLEKVKKGSSILLSNSFTYDPSLHCFQKETDEVIQQLIQVVHDEKCILRA